MHSFYDLSLHFILAAVLSLAVCLGPGYMPHVAAADAAAAIATAKAGAFISAENRTNGAPVSIRTSLDFGATWGDEIESIWLAGLGAEPNAPPTALAVEWKQGNWSWFPSWRLQLSSDANLVLASAGEKEVLRGEDGSFVLSAARPDLGHVYETLLSYEPVIGLVSIAVNDVTAEKVVYTGVFWAKPQSASFVAGAGVKGKAGAVMPQISALETVGIYIPAWIDWEIGAKDLAANTYAPAYRVERDSAFAASVSWGAAPLPSKQAMDIGEYRLVVSGSGGEHRTVALQAKDHGWVPLDLGRLPLGMVKTTLQYVTDGKVWLSQSRELSVGSYFIQVGTITAHPESKNLQGSVCISSASDLAGLELTLRAKLRKVVWDEQQRVFQETDAGEKRLFTHKFSGSNGTEVVFTMPLPAEPGLWKLLVSPETNIPVRAEVVGNEQLFATYAPAQPEAGKPFTIAVLPDTQNYTINNPDIFTRQTQWIAENAVGQNIALMLHMGDVTQDNTREQWAKAQHSLSILDGVVPYVLAVGNHDMAPGGGVRARGETLINDYFPTSKFPALGGVFMPGHVENSYHIFSISGMDYMVVSLEFGPPNEVLTWANEAIATHPNHKVIVITHTFVNRDGSRGGDPKRYGLAHSAQTTVNDGKEMWSKLISKHANIFMVMSGHIGVPTIPYNVGVGEKGNKIYSFLMDYQGEPQGGNGWMVLFTFQPDGIVDVQAYSPYLNKNKTEVDSQGFSNHFQINVLNGEV